MSAAPNAELIRYRGVNRRGRGVVGTMGPDRDAAARTVEELFGKGWRWLSVTQGEDEVGAIYRHPDTGRRIWWAEAPDGTIEGKT